MTTPNVIPNAPTTQPRDNYHLKRAIATAIGAGVTLFPSVTMAIDAVASANSEMPAALAAGTVATNAYNDFLAAQSPACRVILSSPRQTSMAEWAADVQTSGACGPNAAEVVVNLEELRQAKYEAESQVNSVRSNKSFAEFISRFSVVALAALGGYTGNLIGTALLNRDKPSTKDKGTLKPTNTVDEIAPVETTITDDSDVVTVSDGGEINGVVVMNKPSDYQAVSPDAWPAVPPTNILPDAQSAAQIH